MTLGFNSQLNEHQVLSDVHDAVDHVLRVALATADPSVTINTTPSAGQLVTEKFDYISVTYPLTTQEVYSYKLGGAGGTLVATVTANYVDSTKAQLLNIAKT